MSRQVLDELKQQISLLDYLQDQDWRPCHDLERSVKQRANRESGLMKSAIHHICKGWRQEPFPG
jgi:hypothetical protein